MCGCQLAGWGSVCGPFQSSWVKYEIQLPGLMPVYGTQPCCTVEGGERGGVCRDHSGDHKECLQVWWHSQLSYVPWEGPR